MRRLVVIVVLVATLLVAGTTSAFAASGTDYGTCVVTHADMMSGFTGDMNPGVHHQGYSNWDGTCTGC